MVELSLAILRRTFDAGLIEPDRGPALQLALRVLLPYVGRHALVSFWNVTALENPLQRKNNLRKAYENIEALALHGLGTRRAR